MKFKMEVPDLKVPLFLDDMRWTEHDLKTMKYSLRDGAPPEVVESFKKWEKMIKLQEESGHDY